MPTGALSLGRRTTQVSDRAGVGESWGSPGVDLPAPPLAGIPSPSGPADAVAEVGDAGALEDVRSVEGHRGVRQLAEERGPAAQQDRRELDPDLVEQARFQTLCGDRGCGLLLLTPLTRPAPPILPVPPKIRARSSSTAPTPSTARSSAARSTEAGTPKRRAASSYAGFASAGGRRPSSAVWRIGSR
jgi:hypothetical protein